MTWFSDRSRRRRSGPRTSLSKPHDTAHFCAQSRRKVSIERLSIVVLPVYVTRRSPGLADEALGLPHSMVLTYNIVPSGQRGALL